MTDNKSFEDFKDPLMIIMITVDLLKLQYDGVMDTKITGYLNRIEKASKKIELLLKELQAKHKVYNK